MAVAATGFFDGVHLGHREVLARLCAVARERGEESLVVSFWPHPRSVLQQDADKLRLLTSLDEKRALCRACGVDRFEVLPFTRAFSGLTALLPYEKRGGPADNPSDSCACRRGPAFPAPARPFPPPR